MVFTEYRRIASIINYFTDRGSHEAAQILEPSCLISTLTVPSFLDGENRSLLPTSYPAGL